jgi:hypothetical protein
LPVLSSTPCSMGYSDKEIMFDHTAPRTPGVIEGEV